MRTRAERKFVAKATALGARVPQAELFVLGQKTKHEADRRKHLLFATDVTTVTFIKNIKDQPIAK